MAVASRYGVGEIVDAYQIATTWMLWLPTTLGGAITVVLIPKLVELKTRPAELNEFLSELQGVALLLGSLLGGLALILMPFLLPMVAGGLAIKTQEFVGSFGVGMIIPVALSLLITLNSARLMARHHQWNTLLEGMPALMILGFVTLWPQSGLVSPLLLGTLLGYTLQNLVLARLANHQTKGRIGMKFSMRSSHWASLRDFVSLMVLAQFFLSWTTPLDMATASRLGEGAIAQLSYAERVLSLIIGLGAMAISRAILPVFSEMKSKNDWNLLRKTTFQWGIFMGLLGLAVACLAWIFAPWVIKLLYERGQFTSTDTANVAEIFRWGLTRLPFYFVSLIFFQLLASHCNFAAVAVINLICIFVKYLLNEFLARYFGISGINISTSVMYAVSMLCLLSCALQLKPRHAS